MPTTRNPLGLASVLTILLLATGGSASAEDAAASPEPASGLARDLLAARQANAKAQHEGRPAVWFFSSPPTSEARRADTRE